MDGHWTANSRKVNRGLSGSRTHLLLVSCTCFYVRRGPCLLSNRGKDFECGQWTYFSPPEVVLGSTINYKIVRRLLNLEVVRLMIIARWVCENEAKYVHYFNTGRINWFMIETLF